MGDYRIADDIALLQELLGCSRRNLAKEIGRSVMTLNRWVDAKNSPTDAGLADLYGYAFRKGVRLNEIKAQLYQEEHSRGRSVVVFHGSKYGIQGNLSLGKSRADNDFGPGFYCGENLRQAAVFVARFPRSSLYMFAFDPCDLACASFDVDQDWMLTIAYFRGRLDEYADHPRITRLRKRVEEADYAIAPIADNRMFEIIDSFVDGEITDVQCRHSLSATNLGRQYVLTSDKALRSTHLLECCYLCREERDDLLDRHTQESRTGIDKSKAARRQYRNKGLYVEELLS